MGKLLHHTIEGSHIAFPWLEIPVPASALVRSGVLRSQEPTLPRAEQGYETGKG